ncbi:MAG: glutamine synthetase family protein [Proteobacteria bacterium]|nr:glutamine synthetase family protein [Pseudomonadota bacterium]
MTTGTLTLEKLRKEVKAGAIDTVIAAFPDMQGRLMGKRFEANYFVDGAYEETHGCNYLLAVDVDMEPVPGYKSASWEKGYGDYVIKPDLATIRLLPWLPKTAMVLSDLLDHHTHELVPYAPRSVLKKQLKRLEALKMKAYFASELEFFVFDQNFKQAYEGGYRTLTTPSHLNGDYNLLQTTKEEGLMRAIRNGLYGAGITVENSKGEAWAGQEEINVRYDAALPMADTHVFLKHACKEIAQIQGQAITFMAKPNYGWAGSSSHVHQSLWSADGKTPMFYDKAGNHGMSAMMEQYLAGQLSHAGEITYFLAPYINSYKRYMAGTFAPTRAIWSFDNRTAGYRICGVDTKAIRVECRVGGADLNPYLAFAALLAAGLDGIDKKMKLEPAFSGDAYDKSKKLREIPKTLREATELLDGSKLLRGALGDDVVDHYVHTAKWEQFEYDRRVTDWELRRGFEQY